MISVLGAEDSSDWGVYGRENRKQSYLSEPTLAKRHRDRQIVGLQVTLVAGVQGCGGFGWQTFPSIVAALALAPPLGFSKSTSANSNKS